MNKPLLFIVILLLLLMIGVGFWYFSQHGFWTHGTKSERRIGRKLYQFAKENDFLFLQQICLKVDDFFVRIPALLIGNKYFYYIEPFECRGTISGKDSDRKWVLTIDGNKTLLDNPIKKSDLIIEYLIEILKLESDDFINICVVVHGGKIENFDVTRANAALIHESDITRFIKTSEKEARVNVYQSEDIEYVANQLYEKHKQSLAYKKRYQKGKKQGDK